MNRVIPARYSLQGGHRDRASPTGKWRNPVDAAEQTDRVKDDPTQSFRATPRETALSTKLLCSAFDR